VSTLYVIADGGRELVFASKVSALSLNVAQWNGAAPHAISLASTTGMA